MEYETTNWIRDVYRSVKDISKSWINVLLASRGYAWIKDISTSI